MVPLFKCIRKDSRHVQDMPWFVVAADQDAIPACSVPSMPDYAERQFFFLWFCHITVYSPSSSPTHGVADSHLSHVLKQPYSAILLFLLYLHGSGQCPLLPCLPSTNHQLNLLNLLCRLWCEGLHIPSTVIRLAHHGAFSFCSHLQTFMGNKGLPRWHTPTISVRTDSSLFARSLSLLCLCIRAWHIFFMQNKNDVAVITPRLPTLWLATLVVYIPAPAHHTGWLPIYYAPTSLCLWHLYLTSFA